MSEKKKVIFEIESNMSGSKIFTDGDATNMQYLEIVVTLLHLLACDYSKSENESLNVAHKILLKEIFIMLNDFTEDSEVNK